MSWGLWEETGVLVNPGSCCCEATVLKMKFKHICYLNKKLVIAKCFISIDVSKAQEGGRHKREALSHHL